MAVIVFLYLCVCVRVCVASAVSCGGAAGLAAVYLEICGCSETGLPRYENGCWQVRLRRGCFTQSTVSTVGPVISTTNQHSDEFKDPKEERTLEEDRVQTIFKMTNLSL